VSRPVRAWLAPALALCSSLLPPHAAEARPALPTSAGASSAASGTAPPREAEVTVTASRLEEPLDESPASVTVIRRADIERAQARTVEELLAGVEGLSIAGGGGLGKVTSVFVRGAESDHTLWLVDGVRIGSVTTGTPR